MTFAIYTKLARSEIGLETSFYFKCISVALELGRLFDFTIMSAISTVLIRKRNTRRTPAVYAKSRRSEKL